MASYTRQSTINDGDTITAALFNNEFNQLLAAFNNSTGHAHDGTAAEGPVIGLIGDAGETSPNNKVLIDTSNNHIEFYVEVSSSSVQQLRIQDGAIVPITDSDVDLGTSSLYFKDAFIDSITTTGNVSVGGNLDVTGTIDFSDSAITNVGSIQLDSIAGDADSNTSITFSGSDVITVAAGGDNQVTFTNGAIVPSTDNDIDLGSSSSEFKDLFIDGTANIDSLVADTADINGGTVDGAIIGGSSAAAITGTTITGTSFVIGSADISEAELETIDGVTAGTVAASKAVVVDSNKDIGSFRNVTLTGELDAGSLDISGDADIDGTLEADAITVNGATLNEVITDAVGGMVSSNTETGISVTFEDGDNTLDFVLGSSQTTISSLLNTSLVIGRDADNDIDFATDNNIIFRAAGADQIKLQDGALVPVTNNDIDLGTSSLEFKDAFFDGTVTADAFAGPLTGNVTGNVSGTAATVTGAAQSNITSLGTLTTLTVDNVIINGTTIGHTDDTDLMTLADGVLTVAGEVDAVSLDVSGDVDIDGTLEADAITVNGVTLAETISDTVGAMVSSNTETNITVSYDDSDNTLDFVVGTLNQDTTGNAATATALETARNIHGVSFDGTGNIDLTEVIQDTVGAMFSSNTETNITATYQDADGTIDLVAAASTSFVVEDDDGTEVTIDNGKELKIIGSGITTNFTDTSDGSDADPFDLTLTIDAAQTGITSLLATDIKIGEDDETKIDFETADEIHFYAANAEQVFVSDGVFGPQTDSDVDLGTTGVRFKDAYVDSITVTGEVDGASLDISGDADIDGTLEADAITVNGTALDEFIQDTVGAMVSSNTESGISVTYEDSDGTLDFSVSGGSSTSIADADSDTKIQVEESSDEDTIRFDTAGTERITLGSTGIFQVTPNTGVTAIRMIDGSDTHIEMGSEKAMKSGGSASNFAMRNDGGNIHMMTNGQNNRLIVFQNGDISIGGSTGSIINSSSATGAYFEAGTDLAVARSGGAALSVLRQTNDGQLIRFKQAGSEEGSINVSGSSVSLQGFTGTHETSGIADDTAIGTVVSTIDELDTYVSGSKSGQTRAEHPKVKVSDSVGDSRVYGVLQSRTESDNKPLIASVGLGTILVTGACSGGDLLESNGDGTAKVQDDDIIRSKTIGKVTIGNNDAGVKSVSCVLYCG